MMRNAALWGCTMDHHRLLSGVGPSTAVDVESLDDDALLAELGVEVEAPEISALKHVRSTAEKKAAEEIAGRDKCEDFDAFKPLFGQIQKELDTGLRETRKFELKAEIEPGRFFIVGGQKAYVAEMGEVTLTDQGRTDARLRVIFDNGNRVHWMNIGYVVTRDCLGKYLITFTRNCSAIGLTNRDGTRLNGRPEEFFIGDSVEVLQ